MELHAQEWLKTVRQEYLQRFVTQGGSAVKFVVSEHKPVAEWVRTQLDGMARQDGFCTAHVESRDTKIHMTDRFFHQVAQLIDWDQLAYQFVTQLLREHGYQIPDDRAQFSLAEVAKLNDRAEPLLRRDLNSWLEGAIFKDPDLCQEFKMAMIRLCLAQLDSAEASPFLTQAVNQWLRGELRQLSALKEALIFQKIVRHNARHMFASLTRWLRLVGKQGLVVTIDIDRYLVGKRPEQGEGLYYSAAAAMDTYEMLRQFIDGTDEMEGFLLVVMAPSEFLTDGRRGLDRYEALKLRIWDEVRDRTYQNPLGALIRLTESTTVLESRANEEYEENSSVQNPGNVFHQRVIEALRSGVPNRDVVQALGSNQPEIEGKFTGFLQELGPRVATNTMAKGLVIAGGFGAGKSHLLESLQHRAVQENVVCSQIVISKETPFYNVVTLFRAAVDSAIVPNKRGHALTEIASELNFQSPQYAEFYGWAQRQQVGEVDARLAATLYLYEQMVNDPELSHRMIRFWSGDPLSNGELKKYLKGCSPDTPYTFQKISAQELALQRFRFVSRLIVAAGYAGWVLLIDEAEIVARYSFKQRAKSYAELARWTGRLETSCFPGLGSVVALTDDFQSVVLDEKGDREKVFESVNQPDADRVVQEAEYGIQVIDRDRMLLGLPHEQMVEETYEKVRGLHASAYAWAPPPVTTVDQLSSTRMREYVRGWITEWDLKRLTPDADVHIEVSTLTQDYSEDAELETVVEDDPEGSKEESGGDPLLALAMENQSLAHVGDE
ncbi:MAG: BREX system ATP-binding domain-containing protein [Nitrospirales bacterium]